MGYSLSKFEFVCSYSWCIVAYNYRLWVFLPSTTTLKLQVAKLRALSVYTIRTCDVPILKVLEPLICRALSKNQSTRIKTKLTSYVFVFIMVKYLIILVFWKVGGTECSCKQQLTKITQEHSATYCIHYLLVNPH